MAFLSLGALGVVFGDIGTSPLYALRESLAGEHGLPPSDGNVLGVLSLIFWSLIIVVTVKYLLIVMRADNEGEGGILALTSLVTGGTARTKAGVMLFAGLFGTALLYGDGMITPAISVLSAVEGIEVAAPSVNAWVPYIAAAILVGLFAIQKHGTGSIGTFFGPIMVVWFAVLALLGTKEIVQEPGVVRALDPTRALSFFADNGMEGFLVLGSVFLVVTGGEALYADMGHFGRRPIELGWFSMVLPALLLNYFGQGAMLLQDPEAIESPFYLLAPDWARWPLTGLATAATVIASQALITGAFSLTVQAVNLDYLPRARVVQTSTYSRGQVYVPAINWFLLVACVALVFAFGSSTGLAAAYGVAVTLTMVITTLLVGHVALHLWGWSRLAVGLLLVPLFLVDLAFAAANVFKIPHGGWFPLVIGVAGFAVFTTWYEGRKLVGERILRHGQDIDDFIAEVQQKVATRQVERHRGTGVYLHRTAGLVPPALVSNLNLGGSLHEHVVLLSIDTSDAPYVMPVERATVVNHTSGFHELRMRYGFAERPDISNDLPAVAMDGFTVDPETTTYFLGREHLEVTSAPGMPGWQEHLFTFMHRNAANPASHFGIPTDRIVVIGIRIDL
jgi:KUP system potassium uptake protein